MKISTDKPFKTGNKLEIANFKKWNEQKDEISLALSNDKLAYIMNTLEIQDKKIKSLEKKIESIDSYTAELVPCFIL